MDRTLSNELLDILDAKLKEHTVSLMCELCGHTGTDVHEQPRYDAVNREDTTMYLCDDAGACLDCQEDNSRRFVENHRKEL